MSDKNKVSCPVTGCPYYAEVDWTGRITAIQGLFMLADHIRHHDPMELATELLKRKLAEFRSPEVTK